MAACGDLEGVAEVDARRLRSLWLAAVPDEAVDTLALAALDAIEGRRVYREALLAAIDLLTDARVDHERLEARYHRALDDARELRRTRGAAA